MLCSGFQETLHERETALNPQAVTYLDPLICVDKEICGLYGWRRLHLEEWVQYLYLFQLSGGMVRRVRFLTAVITDASLIIADEITAIFDPITQAQIWSVILCEIEKNRTMLIAITHNEALVHIEELQG